MKSVPRLRIHVSEHISRPENKIITLYQSNRRGRDSTLDVQVSVWLQKNFEPNCVEYLNVVTERQQFWH